MLDGTCRPFGLAQDIGHFRVAEPLDEAQEDHLALLLAKAADRSPDFVRVEPGLDLDLRVGPGRLVALVRIQKLVERDVAASDPIVVDDQVVGEPEEPRPEGQASVLVARYRLPRLEKDLLGQILGLVLGLDAVGDVTVDAVDVQLVELPEGIRVSHPSPGRKISFARIPVVEPVLPQGGHPFRVTCQAACRYACGQPSARPSNEATAIHLQRVYGWLGRMAIGPCVVAETG